MRIRILGLFVLLMSFPAWAQYRSAEFDGASRSARRPTWIYELGASSGTYNQRAYNEVHLALNWNFSSNFTWRNSAFSRFGSQIDSVGGLDSSLRFVYDIAPTANTMGFGFFAGPGYRISDEKNSGFLAEAGLTVKIAGLALGVGVKSVSYSNPGRNADGTEKPKTDSNVFIILAGGGAF